MSSISPPLRVRARGQLACFTRPELKVERVSYEVMTPSAARGLLEAVLWKPAVRWRVRRIYVLSDINFTAFRRNEVNSRAITPSAKVVKEGGEFNSFYADEDRAQRNTVALRNVDYVIEAQMEMTKRAGPQDNMTKFVAMFERRLEGGQHFHQPCLGCREFVADVLPAPESFQTTGVTKPLGLMLWDIRFSKQGNTPLFFNAHLQDGVLDVPNEPLGFGEEASA